MDASKETLRADATSSEQPKPSSEISSPSESLTKSKQPSIDVFLTSRRTFSPNHEADLRIFFEEIRTYENERADRQQKIAPANWRSGKLVLRGKELAQRFSTPPAVIFKDPALQARKAVQSIFA